ncbi:MAG: S-layer protein [Candidatus Aenigmarchaeota archaeon]|nr:S-layer protein [Candidatus Aenigmarchaeota archaeon]
MKIKKWIATGLSALMAGSTIAAAGLAATSLKDFPGFLGATTATSSALDAFVVVGADAKTSDVVGAVDLAARLAELSYTVESVSGATPTGFNGIDKDGIRIGLAANGDDLSVGGTDYSNPLPAGATIKNFHWTGLKDSTYTWRSSTYDWSEQLWVGGAKIRHTTEQSGVNGTLTLEVESGDIRYQYVFDKTISGTGDGTTKNYTYPISIELLGKPFSIVGTDTDKIVMLVGATGTADATKGVTSGDYTVYATLGSNDKWAKVVLQDKAGTTVDTLVINEGDTKTSTVAKLDIKLLDSRALADGTVVGADLVVGPEGQTEKDYDTSADTTSTGTSSDRFSGETTWGIRAASGGSNFTNANRGTVQSGSIIEVVYQPTSTQYLKAGESLKLPNNYGEVKLVGYGTEKLAKVTIEPVNSEQSVYNSTGDKIGEGKGLKISSVDEKGTKLASILAANGNAYSEAYVLMGKQLGTGANPYPVYFGFWDTTNSRIKTADRNLSVGASTGANTYAYGITSFAGGLPLGTSGANTSYVTSEFAAAMLNTTDTDGNGRNGDNVTYSYRLSYGGSGEKSDWRLNVTVSARYSSVIGNVTIGDPGNFNLELAFQNKTKWDTQTFPEIRLGGTAASAESTDVNSTQETSRIRGIGKQSKDVIDDNGLVVVTPDANSAGDKVQILVASRELTARMSVGKVGGEAPTVGTTNKIAPITSAVAKLDTEVGSAEKAKNLVLVGGPCVNKLTAEALGKTYPACGASSGITQDTALIQAVDGAFATGKVALVVAGWESDNTRLATSVLQNYGAHLKAVTASKVTVTGTVSVPVVKEG